MILEFTGTQQAPQRSIARIAEQPHLEMLRDALLAICDGNWDQAEHAIRRDGVLAARDPACLNLLGIVAQARHQWTTARRFFRKALRAKRCYAPAEQNMRRLYELDTFGKTFLPIALIDQATMIQVRHLPQIPGPRLEDIQALKGISLWVPDDATINAVKRTLDWRGYAWAVATVAAATAIGWPLVHSSLHLANVNVLMLYLLSVLWVATRFSRSAAVIASLLGVATFDFVFVLPYYTFAVADEQYLVTFAVMMLTALVISSLTHRAREQAELARQAWERVEAEFLRNTLLSGVSHELRTPLSAIAGASSTLIETDNTLSSDVRGELLETIHSESDRMERLITNLLDMTRMEAGGLKIVKEWLPIQEVIGSALHRNEKRLHGREVKVKIPTDLPLVHIDSVLIEQVLNNLLDNAIEYTPRESPIEISAARIADEVILEVSDHGPGLPAGTEQRVFEKFFRIQPAESRRGTGLGLAIVRGVVEAHGGQVCAANRDGGGAVFRFTLPIVGTPPAMDSSG